MRRKRVAVSFPEELLLVVKKISKETGIPISEIIRRGTILFLKNRIKNDKIK